MRNAWLILCLFLFGALTGTTWAQGTQSALPEGQVNTDAATVMQATNGRPARQARTTYGESFVIGKDGYQHTKVCTTNFCGGTSTTGTNVKASSGYVIGIQVFTSDTVDCWLKLYDKASEPNVGTDTPSKTIYVPHQLGAVIPWSLGLRFRTGISYAVTALPAATDNTAVTANKISVNVDWR